MKETADFAWSVLKTPLRFKEITAPAASGVPSGTLALYAKSKAGVSNLYFKDDAGVEHDVTVPTGAALTKTDDTNVTLTLGGTPATALLQATSLTLGWTGQLSAARGGTGVAALGDLTKVDDTNVTLTLGGTPTGSLIKGVSLTLGWTGTLGVARGGTNIGSYAVGDLLYASGSTTLSKLADVAAGSYLRSGGVTTAPVWSTLILPNAATANRIVYATSSNTLGESANLAYDGTDFLLGSGTRARMSGQNRFRYLTSVARAIDNAGVSLNDNTVTTIALNGETTDTDSIHDTVTNNSRLTCQLTGKYLVTAIISYSSNSVGIRQCRIKKTGTVAQVNTLTAVNGFETRVLGCDILDLVAGTDYIEVEGYQNSGGSLALVASASTLSMAYIGE